MINNLDKLSLYLFILLPFAILTGPFLSDLFLTIIAIVIFFSRFKYVKNYLNHKIIILLFLLLIIFLCSSVFSENILYSFDYSLFYFRFVLFFISTVYLFEKYENLIIKYTYYVLYSCLFLLSVDSLIEFFFNKAFFGFIDVPNSSIRLKSLFILIDEPVVGAYISKLLPILIGFFLLLKNNKDFKFFCFLVNLSVLVVFLSGERVAFVYAFLSYFFYIIFFFKEKIVKFSSILLISLIFASIFIKPEIYSRMFTQTFDQVYTEKENVLNSSKLEKKYTQLIYLLYSKFPSFSNEHLGFIETALIMHENKPFIGYGSKLFDLNCQNFNKSACANHPHQIYMQIISETGIFSFFILIFIFLYFLFYLFRSIYLAFKFNTNLFKPNIFLLLPPTLYLFPFLPSGSFFTNWNTVLFYYGFSISYFYIKKIK